MPLPSTLQRAVTGKSIINHTECAMQIHDFKIHLAIHQEYTSTDERKNVSWQGTSDAYDAEATES